MTNTNYLTILISAIISTVIGYISSTFQFQRNNRFDYWNRFKYIVRLLEETTIFIDQQASYIILFVEKMNKNSCTTFPTFNAIGYNAITDFYEILQKDVYYTAYMNVMNKYINPDKEYFILKRRISFLDNIQKDLKKYIEETAAFIKQNTINFMDIYLLIKKEIENQYFNEDYNDLINQIYSIMIQDVFIMGIEKKNVNKITIIYNEVLCPISELTMDSDSLKNPSIRKIRHLIIDAGRIQLNNENLLKWSFDQINKIKSKYVDAVELIKDWKRKANIDYMYNYNTKKW